MAVEQEALEFEVSERGSAGELLDVHAGDRSTRCATRRT